MSEIKIRDDNNNNNNNNNGAAAARSASWMLNNVAAVEPEPEDHTLDGIITTHTQHGQDIDLLYDGFERLDPILLDHNNGIKFLLEHCCGGETNLPEYRRLARVFEVRIPERDQGGGGKRKKRGKKRRKTRKINN